MSINNIITKLENLLRSETKSCFVGIWTDEHQMIAAATKVREHGCKDFDCITPFPMHEVDDAVGISRSIIPWVTFFAGLAGCGFGLWFTWWVSAVNWPLNIGGKPMWSLPAFIPVIFELTILFAALSSVGAMFALNGLPKVDPPVIDPDLTCHKFAVYVLESDKAYDKAAIEKIFSDHGAETIKMAEI